MGSRTRLAATLCEWVGPHVVRSIDLGTGWPSTLTIKTRSGWTTAHVYVGPIGLSQRGRDDMERRFQNPAKGRPIKDSAEVRLLLGLHELDAARLIVAMQADRRLDRPSRHSLFMPVHLLRSARAWGWAEHQSTSGERLVAFRPELLPAFVEMQILGTTLLESDIVRLVSAAGADDAEADASSLARALGAISDLLEESAFIDRVRKAYASTCSMCGLKAPFVSAAAILPLSAPRALRDVCNGIAACPNHAAAFDRCLIYVDAQTLEVRLHPEYHCDGADVLAGQSALHKTLRPKLWVPEERELQPRGELIAERYRSMREQYLWV
jgi:hypothetical protein